MKIVYMLHESGRRGTAYLESWAYMYVCVRGNIVSLAPTETKCADI